MTKREMQSLMIKMVIQILPRTQKKLRSLVNIMESEDMTIELQTRRPGLAPWEIKLQKAKFGTTFLRIK